MESSSLRGRLGETLVGALGSSLAESDVTLSGERVAPGSWFERSAVWVAAAVLCFHVISSAVFPTRGWVTCLGLGICYALASFAALHMRMVAKGAMRMRWLLMAAAMGFGVLGFALTWYQERLLGLQNPFADTQVLMLMLRGVPLLMAVCLGGRELGRVFIALDLAQASLMALLAGFVLLFGAPHFSLVTDSLVVTWIMIANVTVALLATVRCFGVSVRGGRQFFVLVAIFLWANALAMGWIDFYVIARWHVTAGSPWLAVGDLPVLGFLVALSRHSTQEALACHQESPTFGETACSFFIPACNFLLAASIVPTHVAVGVAGVATAFALYGLRSSVELKSSLVAQNELLQANRSMQDQAFSDALTAIPNRRSFDLTLEREWKRAQRSRQPLALLMFDVDRFKDLNDLYGHLAGDECLRGIAKVLRTGLGRQADFASRYGGEEFAVLLVDTAGDGARTVAESLRRAVELHHCLTSDGTQLSFTVSVGVASEVPMHQESSLTLVAAADKALYRAKRNGRNRVEVHAWRTDAMREISAS